MAHKKHRCRLKTRSSVAAWLVFYKHGPHTFQLALEMAAGRPATSRNLCPKPQITARQRSKSTANQCGSDVEVGEHARLCNGVVLSAECRNAVDC